MLRAWGAPPNKGRSFEVDWGQVQNCVSRPGNSMSRRPYSNSREKLALAAQDRYLGVADCGSRRFTAGFASGTSEVRIRSYLLCRAPCDGPMMTATT